MPQGTTELMAEVLDEGREGPVPEEGSQSWGEHTKQREGQVQGP